MAKGQSAEKRGRDIERKTRRGVSGTSGSWESRVSATIESFTFSTSMIILRPSGFDSNYRWGGLSHIGGEGPRIRVTP